MNQTDKSKLIPHIRFIEKEWEFLEIYKKDIKRFFQIAEKLLPAYLNHLKKQIQER